MANQNGVTCNNNLNGSIEDVNVKNVEVSLSAKQNQKFIISSNCQLYEDDLSKIDVKSLVRKIKDFIFTLFFYFSFFLLSFSFQLIECIYVLCVN